MKTQYETKNDPITGMSDDEFYGRESALGVDIGAAKAAAVREARRAYDKIINGGASDARLGALMLRRAVYRLAVTLGNQSIAEEYLWLQPAPALGNVVTAEERADMTQLDLGVTRQHAHPALIEDLRQIESQIGKETSRHA